MTVQIRSDPVRTRQRIAELEQYMSAHVSGPAGFCCTSVSECRASALISPRTGQPRPDTSFWAGQLSHVGHHYDVLEDDRPWSVLVLGMETGRSRENVSLIERRREQAPVIERDPKSRTPHMKGTASALRLAFGGEPGPDRGGELLHLANTDQPVHVMDAYALANVRLCSAVITGTSSSRGTPKMTRNCSPHFEATVRILEPTLCILQSGPARRQLAPVLSDVEGITEYLERVTIGGVPLYLASFVHPYQQGRQSDKNWGGSFSTPYLDEIVAPTIRLARELALGDAPRPAQPAPDNDLPAHADHGGRAAPLGTPVHDSVEPTSNTEATTGEEIATESASDDAVLVLEDETGALLVGSDAAVAAVLDTWEQDAALGAVSSLTGSDLTRAVAEAHQLGVKVAEVGRHVRRIRRSTEDELRLIKRDAHGRFLSNVPVNPALVAGGPVALQVAALQMALEGAVQGVLDAVKEVGEKVDELLRLAAAERMGRAIGQRRLLQRRVIDVRNGVELSDTDWSSVAALGTDLEVGVEQVRNYLRRRVRALDVDKSPGDRADALKKARSEGRIGDELRLLAVAERSMFLWQMLRLARVGSAEPEHLAATAVSVRATLSEHLDADVALADELHKRLDAFDSVGPLELHHIVASRKLRRELEPLRRDFDEFVRARGMQAREWGIPTAPGFRPALGELHAKGSHAVESSVKHVEQASGAVNRRAADWTKRRANKRKDHDSTT
jgi:hypothetical protein